MTGSRDGVLVDPVWRPACGIGGWAALLAGVLFRRNLAAEVAAVSGRTAPQSVAGWFDILQAHRLLGLTLLNIWDVVNYLLLALMFLGLAVALWRSGRVAVTVALVCALLGAIFYAATNTALSMLSLSGQFSSAGADRRPQLLAAGESLLALGRFTSGAHPGSAGYLSLLLVAAGSLIFSVIMLRSALFGRPTAIVGIVGSLLDIGYCVAYIVLPAASPTVLAFSFIPAAGLFWMVWHLMVGWRLLRLSRAPAIVAGTGMPR